MDEDRGLGALVERFKLHQFTPISTAGFFTTPFVASDGLHRGLVVKVYRGIADRELARRVVQVHQGYLQTLRDLDLNVPDTRMTVVSHGRSHHPIAIQEPFMPQELLRNTLSQASVEECVALLTSAFNTVCHFWTRAGDCQSPESVGLHASIQNFGHRQHVMWHLDLFPPLLGLSRVELHHLMLTFSPRMDARLGGLAAFRLMDRVTDEYYSREANILGLLCSACRLRPEHSIAFLQATQEFVDVHDHLRWKATFRRELERPPRLSFLWILGRRLLRIKGAPNVKGHVHVPQQNRSDCDSAAD